MQHINSVRQSNRINSMIGTPFITLHYFQNPRRAKVLERVRISMFLSSLCKVDGEPENVFHVFRHAIEVFLGRPIPLIGLRGGRIMAHYGHIGIIVQFSTFHLSGPSLLHIVDKHRPNAQPFLSSTDFSD